MDNLLQRNFLKVRNDHIIPVVSVSKIGLREYATLKLKKAILENLEDVSNPASNDYEFRVPKKIIDKSRLSEIEQFYLRSIYQKMDFTILNEKGTPSWMVTTQYYRFYFLATCLQRVLNIGYFWIQDDESKELSSVLSSHLGTMVNLGKGNYRYVIEPSSSDPRYYKVLLTKQGSNMHQETWSEMKQTFNKFIVNSNRDERKFLEELKLAYNSISNFSPSTTRNQVNYSSETSILELNNQIQCSSIKLINIESALKRYKSSTVTNNSIKLITIMSEYLDSFISALLSDLLSRQKGSCKLILKFEKKNSIKLIS